jgi:glyoxylate/hydroxypyruvate reductase
MVILFMDRNSENKEIWLGELRKNLPDHEIRAWPEETGDRAQIEIAVVGAPAPGELERLPNLKAVLSTWAGVDRLVGKGIIPDGIPLARMVDRSLRADMTLFVIHWVLHFHREIHRYGELQREARWEPQPYCETAGRRVGIMGLGVLGGDAAGKLVGLGFDVAGWDAIERPMEGVTGFVGQDRLPPFLERTEILVSLLPLTPQTEGILNRRTLSALPRGACVISCARGGHVVDADLLEALDSGHLDAAALDVFREEPLPATHPFWRHPRVRLTPHVAAATNPRTAAEEIAEDVRRMVAGSPPRHLVDMARGY